MTCRKCNFSTCYVYVKPNYKQKERKKAVVVCLFSTPPTHKEIVTSLSKTPILGCKAKSQLLMFFLIILLFSGNDLSHGKQYSHFFLG
jgi:hypothetical protein